MSSVATSVPAAARKTHGLWHYVWKLLRLRLTIFWSGIKRAKTRRKVSIAILALLVLVFAGFLFVISMGVLDLLKVPRLSQFFDLSQIVASLPSTAVSLAFFMFLLTNFGVLLQVLYLANDMDFMLAAPVPMRAVFLAKLMQGILPNFLLVSLFVLPLMFGLGVMQGFNVIYYPLVVIILGTVSLLGAGLAALLVMAVVRVVPPRRVAEILGFFGAVVSILLSQSGQIMARADPSRTQVIGTLSSLSGMDQPWSPLAWAGRGLVALGEGNWAVGLALLLIFAVLASGLFWASLGVAEKLYYTGWARMQASPHKKKAKRSNAHPATAVTSAGAAGLLISRIPTPVRAVIAKDWLLLRRDLRFLSQLIVPLILSVVYAFTTLRAFDKISYESANVVTTFLGRSSVYLSLGVPMFFGWIFILNLTINAFSREGKNYWMLKTSPLTAGRLMAAKFTAAYLPGLALQLLLFGFILAQDWPGAETALYILAATVFYVAGLVGVNLTFGVYGAKLDWEDPRRMNTASTGCLGSIAGIFYVGMAWVLFFVPPTLVPMLGGAEWVGQALGLFLGVTASLVCAYVPPRLALPRVNKIGML